MSDPRARNNARFARFMQARQSDQRGPSILRGAYGAWKLLDDARRTIPPILLPEASGSPSDAFQQAAAAVDKIITDSCLNPTLVNTDKAQNGLQQPSAASEGHQDAKGARRAHAGAESNSVASRATNTQKLRCGENGHQCGWCHFCRVKAGTPCPAKCHHCQMAAAEAADAKAHPEEAAAILVEAKPKKKIERVRGFQI